MLIVDIPGECMYVKLTTLLVQLCVGFEYVFIEESKTLNKDLKPMRLWAKDNRRR